MTAVRPTIRLISIGNIQASAIVFAGTLFFARFAESVCTIYAPPFPTFLFICCSGLISPQIRHIVLLLVHISFVCYEFRCGTTFLIYRSHAEAVLALRAQPSCSATTHLPHYGQGTKRACRTASRNIGANGTHGARAELRSIPR